MLAFAEQGHYLGRFPTDKKPDTICLRVKCCQGCLEGGEESGG